MIADVPSDQVEKLAEKGNSTKEHTHAPIQVLVLKGVQEYLAKNILLQKPTWRWPQVEQVVGEGSQKEEGGQVERERLQSPFPSLLRALLAR